MTIFPNVGAKYQYEDNGYRRILRRTERSYQEGRG